ncbi:MAG: hypothetical protein ACK4GA_02495 [Acinetobacter sp.]|uniref:hypothetical protein n=1 Tax=Acinetobacter sp. TaxID=472 RepID=UPI00391DEFF3
MDNLNDFIGREINDAIKSINTIEADFNSLIVISDPLFLKSSLNKNNKISSNIILTNHNSIQNISNQIKNQLSILNSEIKINDFTFVNYMEESEIKRQLHDINTNLSILSEKIRLNKETTLKVTNKINSVVILNSDQNEVNETLNTIISSFIKLKDEILHFLNLILSSTQQIIDFTKKINNLNNKNELNLIENLKKNTSIILKKYENDVFSLTEGFKNELKSIKLDYDKINKSSKLLNGNIDNGLNKLADLNKKIQNIELEYSRLLNSQNTFIKDELNKVKLKLLNDVELIILDAKEKSESITVQEIEIKNSHNDFIKLVEKAGIYELTQNYKSKADEEKIEYKAFRKYTTWSILAAVAFTLAVFIFAFFENSGNTSPPNYLILISRLSISAMFFILALYLSKQAAKHYESYQENHRTFLQLAALEPFMARMSEEEQKEIRKGLIPSYFNQNVDGKFTAKNDEVDMSMMFTFMDKLSNFGQPKKDTKVVESTAVETK